MRAAVSPHPAARRRASLPWLIGLGWIVVYLLLMAHAGWPWAGRGVLDFGAPGAGALERFGAPIPARVHDGAWHRLLLGPWLQASLLNLVLLTWFYVSVGRQLAGLVGRARAWLVFLLGGLGGSMAQVLAHADSGSVGGSGPFDPILGTLGALLLWGLVNTGGQASRVTRSTVLTLLFVGALTWYFTREAGSDPAMRALLGREAAIASLATGIATMALLRPRRPPAATGRLVVLLAWAGLAVLGVAVARQAPAVLASAEREEAQRFLEQLEQTEYEAWWIAQNPTRASPAKRTALDGRLDAVAAHGFLDGHAGRDALRAYVVALRPYARGDVPRPWETEGRCRDTFGAWYRDHEVPLRKRLGIAPRSSARRFWEAP